MKFHDVTNTYDSLTHNVNYLLGFKESDTTQFSLAAKARATNLAKYELASMFWQHSSAWDWDDSGYTNLPIVTANLVADQRDYTLPSDAIMIERVDIMNNSGEYYRIKATSKDDIKRVLEDYGEDSGTPARYWLDARSIFIDPPPDASSVTLTAGIRIYLNREINEFTDSTTTTEVGMGALGDFWIAYRVAHEFALIHKPNKAVSLGNKMNELELKVLGQHTQSLKDIEQRMLPQVETYE